MADEAVPGANITMPREVPVHDLVELRPKSQRHALVIPVVNEGERIRRQLRDVAVLGPKVDVVIADGGSDDGSVAEEFLRQVGVRALLVKRGPGRLSAQLRMAYAWCLDQGYEGIVLATAKTTWKPSIGSWPSSRTAMTLFRAHAICRVEQSRQHTARSQAGGSSGARPARELGGRLSLY